MQPLRIDVALALPLISTYTYSVPEQLQDMVAPGKRVLVPLGRRRVTGYILGDQTSEIPNCRIRHILDILDDIPLFPESMIRFFRWMAEYYVHPLGEVIQTALPGGMNPHDVSVFSLTEAGKNHLENGISNPMHLTVLRLLSDGEKTFRQILEEIDSTAPSALLHSLEKQGDIQRSYRLNPGVVRPRNEWFVRPTESLEVREGLNPARRRILDAVFSAGEIPLRRLRRIHPVSQKQIEALKEAGYIELQEKPVFHDPFGEPLPPDFRPVLMDEQVDAVSRIIPFLGQSYQAFLLNGVTGSGKTEVYLRITETAVSLGLPVIVLVPEIALISQIEARFRARFGPLVAVLHSGLSTMERFDQWRRIITGEARIAIGARSVLFAPFEKSGLIIVDEEHDPSFKQDSGLRYQARDMALVRAKLEGGVAVLGSATPSIQSCYNVTLGKIAEIRLEKRVEDRGMPAVDVVDMCRKREEKGIHRILSREMVEGIEQALGRGEQVLLFLNRRGFASLPVCTTCGEILRCRNCDISLTFHRSDETYRCHYCGFTIPSHAVCFSCSGNRIKHLGMGTEKIEAGVRALFPQARVARMDRDTTSRKGALLQILKSLRNREIDILIGTQMITKGHDFPYITLVGVISADQSLHFPDFRAAERTFQLLSQVSGRAGRSHLPGRVILQTYTPGHFSLQYAIQGDFQGFFEHEIAFRKSLKYPPFIRLAQVLISGRDPKRAEAHAKELGKNMQGVRQNGFMDINILGPVEAFLPKLEKRYRWQVLLKSAVAGRIQAYLRRMLREHPGLFTSRQVHVAIDVDPGAMM